MVQWRIGWQVDCWEGVIIGDLCAETLISSTDKNLVTGQEILLHFQNNICEESDYCKFRQVSVQKTAHYNIFQAYVLSRDYKIAYPNLPFARNVRPSSFSSFALDPVKFVRF